MILIVNFYIWNMIYRAKVACCKKKNWTNLVHLKSMIIIKRKCLILLYHIMGLFLLFFLSIILIAGKYHSYHFFRHTLATNFFLIAIILF